MCDFIIIFEGDDNAIGNCFFSNRCLVLVTVPELW